MATKLSNPWKTTKKQLKGYSKLQITAIGLLSLVIYLLIYCFMGLLTTISLWGFGIATFSFRTLGAATILWILLGVIKNNVI